MGMVPLGRQGGTGGTDGGKGGGGKAKRGTGGWEPVGLMAGGVLALSCAVVSKV